jgi:hypothetical protein
MVVAMKRVGGGSEQGGERVGGEPGYILMYFRLICSI